MKKEQEKIEQPKYPVSAIKYTKDYSLFSINPENRVIGRKHVEDIKADMIKNGYRASNPVIVSTQDKNGKPHKDGKLRIEDGQHKKTAAEELGWKISYVVDNNYRPGDMHTQAGLQEKWDTEAYRHNHAYNGNENYQKMGKFRDLHPGLGWTICIELLGRVTIGGITKRFKDGKFKVDPTNKAVAIAALLDKLNKTYKGHKTMAFKRAVIHMFYNKKFKEAHFLKKMNSHLNDMTEFKTKSGYVQALEEAYNSSMPKAKRVRFFIL